MGEKPNSPSYIYDSTLLVFAPITPLPLFFLKITGAYQRPTMDPAQAEPITLLLPQQYQSTKKPPRTAKKAIYPDNISKDWPK
jgi:hypothetical protein